MRARPLGDAATSSGPIGESTMSKPRSSSASAAAASRKRASSSGETVMDPPRAQAPDARGGGLPCRLGCRVERERDVVVGEVVGVAENDGGELGRGQLPREVLDLGGG